MDVSFYIKMQSFYEILSTNSPYFCFFTVLYLPPIGIQQGMKPALLAADISSKPRGG